MSDDTTTSTRPGQIADTESSSDQTSPPQPDTDRHVDDLAGQVLSGRYEVEQCLGRGAMGAVYRAQHTLMRKTVAIKVLRPHIDGQQDLVERFHREAQAAANITHPNICSATDFGQTDDGTFFLVIEYLDGQTLAELLAREGALGVDRCVDIAAQICAGLDRAHQLDVVHRDLKPENIMLVSDDGGDDGGDNERVKILDFGVAKVRLTDDHKRADLTKAGTVWGTPTYMSPEQAAGGDVDGRSDLYSLGVICYEMLTGRPPFDDDNPARLMAMHLTEQPPPLDGLAAGVVGAGGGAPPTQVPAALTSLVMRMLAKSPQDRPASAQTLRDTLVPILADQRHTPGSEDQRGNQLDGPDTSGPDTSGPDTSGPDTSGPDTSGPDTSGPITSAQTPKMAVSMVQRGSDVVDLLLESTRPTFERVLTWFRRQPALTQGALAGVAAATIVAMFSLPLFVVVTAVGGPTTPQQRRQIQRELADERADYLQSTGLGDIPKALADGRTTDALDALAKIDDERQKNAHIAYLRGRVNGARGRWQAAMDGYDDALAAAPEYANDASLTGDVFERFSAKSTHRAAHARRIIEQYLDTMAVTQQLADLAKSARRSAVRDRAFDVLQTTQRLADLEEWNQLSIELRRADGCDAKANFIAQLADTGDPHALDVLTDMAARGKRGCGFLGLKDCLGCVRSELDDAIATLRD